MTEGRAGRKGDEEDGVGFYQARQHDREDLWWLMAQNPLVLDELLAAIDLS